MKQFIGTFGIGHELGDRYQPITAPDLIEAQKEMHLIYGTEYAFIYTKEHFEGSKEKGFFRYLKPLQAISVKEAV